MKSKRGFMLGEYTLKVVIAVLCILLLFFLLFKLYANSVDQKELELAKASVDEIAEKMEEARLNGNSEVIVLNPTKKSFSIKDPVKSTTEVITTNDWWIIAWPYEDEDEKPIQCDGNYCICICTIPENYKSIFSIFSIREKSIDECNNLGVCKDFDELITTGNSPIVIENPPVNLEISFSGGKFTVSEK